MVKQVNAKLKVVAYLLGAAVLATPLAGCDVTDNKTTSELQQSDPISLDLPIAYVQRPLPLDENGATIALDLLDPSAFNPGAVLVIKERASAAAAEVIITEGVFPPLFPDGDASAEPVEPLYDVKDLSVSADGKKLLFAMRAPEIEGAGDDEQPTWNIWQYDIENGGSPMRVITSDLTAERGHDVAPYFLPDGRIVFSSTRQVQTRAMLLDEGKPAYSALDDSRDQINTVLHVMDSDGSDIEQLSFNASQDMQPSVMADGKILFLRRDAIAQKDGISLYRSNQDGSDIEVYYGYHNQDTGSADSEAVLSQPLELPNGQIMAILQPRISPQRGGDIVAIDALNYVEIDQPVRSNAGAQGPAQTSLAAGNIDTTGQGPSDGGYFSSAVPLRDGSNRLLVSWSQCQVMDPQLLIPQPCTATLLEQGAELAPPIYGLWIYDTQAKTQLPVKLPEEFIMFTDAVVITARDEDTDSSITPDAELAAEQLGQVHIRSVYDIDGLDTTAQGIAAMADPLQTSAAERPVRFIRIVKNVPMPDDDVLDFDNDIFGRSTRQGMRDIVGYVPVEPDGSAMFQVPADMPVMFDLLDLNGRRIGTRHENWFYVRPGEQRECTGCHARNSELPHGRRDAEAPSAWAGSDGAPFANSRLLDSFGTAEADPNVGETMAQYYARINGARVPSMDIIFSDEWTDTDLSTAAADINMRYLAVQSTVNRNPADPNCAALDVSQNWAPPTACSATGSWDFLCRTTINYIEHIQPLWEADRRSCDDAGNLIANDTCTACHSRGPAGALMVPAEQLELTGETSIDRNAYITSYAELLFNDNELELQGGALVDRVVETVTTEFEEDEDGNLVLDENGNPIPVIEVNTVPVRAPMSVNGSANSARFFNLFDTDGSHAGRLSPDELKLIAEWIDIGGQYYNNPFVAPAN